MSISIDGAKKKLLKKLAKELKYKLEEAIFEDIGDTVEQVFLIFIHEIIYRKVKIVHGLSMVYPWFINYFSKYLLIKIFPVDIGKLQYEFEDGGF